MGKFLINCNSNIVCAIDVETTGPEAGVHDIIQICILPLDSNLEPNKTIIPFYCDLKPKRKENYSPDKVPNKGKSNHRRDRFLEACTTGLDPYIAADLFDKWFEKLQLIPGKRIIPLGHNWVYDYRFVIDWLGQASFDSYFDSRYRDTQCVAAYLNDCAEFHVEPFPHPKLDLNYLASIYRIPHERAHDALADCVVTAELYRTIIKRSLFHNKAPDPPKKPPDDIVDNIYEGCTAQNQKIADTYSKPGTIEYFLYQLGFMPNNEDHAKAIIKRLILENEWYQRNI